LLIRAAFKGASTIGLDVPPMKAKAERLTRVSASFFARDTAYRNQRFGHAQHPFVPNLCVGKQTLQISLAQEPNLIDKLMALSL